jgi:DNA-binding NtrC family response regulator
LKIARQHPGPIDLLVSDVVMPGRMNGAEMAGVLTEARPETKVFLMSGYFPEMATMKPDWYFVQKPFSATDIREGVRNIVAENCLAAAV